MHNKLRWLGGVLGVVLLVVAGMAIFDICPPEGPWPQPPWCPGSPFSWPFSSPEESVAVEEPDDTPEPEPEETQEQALVSMAESIFSGLTRVQSYYDRGLESMIRFTPGGIAAGDQAGGRLACVRPQEVGPYTIPDGFTSPLPEDGFIPAPEGACGAGALPQVRFLDQTGELVTGERLAEEEVGTISFEALTGENPETKSLESVIAQALQPGDMRLTTAEGWNEALWERLAAEQQPMQSLMEYQLWNTADEIETLIAESIISRMETMGIPAIVIEAFRASDQHGWLASRPARTGDELSSMEIIAEFTGAFEGIIEEERTFTLPAPGEKPEFGPMTGSGEISFDHPTLGLLNFEVELAWSEWDALGRVNGGEMRMVESTAGYEIIMTFLPDGTKEGELYVDGDLAGRVEMIVVGNSTFMEFVPLDGIPVESR